MIDLHIHSHYSYDGQMSIEEIMSESKKMGIKVISLTDHDDISGIEEMMEYGELYKIEVIPGVEISTILNEEIEGIPYFARIHILAYQFNYKDPKIKMKFRKIKNTEKNRWNKIAKYMIEQNDYQISNKNVRSREDLINELLKTRQFSKRSEIKKILNSDSINKLFPPVKMSTKDAIKFIKEVNGIPVLAHPYEGTNKSLYSDAQVSVLIDYLVSHGLEGIETHHYLHLEDNRIKKLWNIAKKHNLLTTIGSDCHSHKKSYNSITGKESRQRVLNSSKGYEFKSLLLSLNLNSDN
jgi:predicted metal-dependent phosphoesterase TrpH